MDCKGDRKVLLSRVLLLITLEIPQPNSDAASAIPAHAS